MVADVAHGAIHLEPFERLSRLTLQYHQLFGALFGRGRVQSFAGQLRRQRHRPPIVNVHHAAGAVGGDDHETVMLARRVLGIGILAYGSAQDRRPVLPANQVGLLLWSAFIHPLEPVVDGDDCSVRPDRAEKWAVGDFLHPGVDRRRPVLRPVWPPSPAHHVGMQRIFFLVEESKLS